MKPRLLEQYKNEIVPKLTEKFNYKNKMQAPKIRKITLNVGMGKGAEDIKLLESAAQELGVITGQKAAITRAKKAISNFKIRKDAPVGCKVTLRGNIMYEFLDRFISIAAPRIRDFKGFSVKSFDQAGNYSFGITEQTIFPEIDYDKIQIAHGMDIVITVSSGSREETYELLKMFGFPFRKD
ncbi:MAG: 50S ribosomal protein L5 [Candidatus Omnitrophota bacterium]